MSSASDLRLAGIAIAAIAMLAGCGPQSTPAPPSNPGLETGSRVAVGPIPGPGDPVPNPENPYKDDVTAQAEGRQLFVRFNCSGCHGGRGGGGMGPSVRDEVWLYGDRDAQIYDSIAQGRGKGMPAWGTRLTEQQIWKLVAYIRSLRTPNEPDAPN